MKNTFSICLIFIFFICACSNSSNPPSTLPAIPTPTLDSALEMPIPTETSKPMQEEEISSTGPWLIYAKSDGIYALNPYGTGPFLIRHAPMTSFAALTFDIPSGLSSASPFIALRVDSPDGHGWDLEILRLPDLTIVFSTPLLSEANYPSAMSMSDLSPDLVQAITDPDALSWSPDGRRLAFVAALDGPSTDLYLYDTETGFVTRLSSGELHVATPVWSYDGTRVIYQVVETFGTGAGWISKSFYSVTPDGETSKLLARFPENSGPAQVLGITQDDLMLISLFSQRDIPELQVIDLKSGGIIAVSSGRILGADVDPVTGAFAFVGEDGQLYFSGNLSQPVEMIDPGPWEAVDWSPIASEFFVMGEEKVDLLFAVMDSYMLSPSFNQGGTLTRSPNGNRLCLAGQTLRCESMNWEQDLGPYPDAFVLWDPYSTGIFFVVADEIYYASDPDFIPVLVDTDLMPVYYIAHTLTPFYIGWVGQ